MKFYDGTPAMATLKLKSEPSEYEGLSGPDFTTYYNNETTGKSGLGVCEPAVDVRAVGMSPIERSKGTRTPEVSSSSESRWKALIASLPSSGGESAYVVGDVLATRSRKGSHLVRADDDWPFEMETELEGANGIPSKLCGELA